MPFVMQRVKLVAPSFPMGHMKVEVTRTHVQFEPLLDSREAAELLRMHYKTLERKVREGVIPGHQILGRWYFRASELDVWVRSGVNSASQSVREN